MKFQRSQLGTILGNLKPGLSGKEIVEQSDCFIFQSNQILTYNDEISVSVPFEADFSCAVPASPLLAALSKFTGDEVEVLVNDGEMKLKCGKRKVGIKIHQDITIPLGALTQPTEWHPTNPDFARALNMVASSCSTDSTTFILTCVHVTPSAVEACDRFQATRYNIKCGLDTDILIPQQAARVLSNLNITEAAVSNSWLFCKANGLTYACRTYCEKYPCLDEMFAVDGKPIEFPATLVDSLQGASVFTDAESKFIRIDFSGGQMNVRAENSVGWFEEQTADVAFDGDVCISINPLFLSRLLKHGSKCRVSDSRLIVENEYYTHIAALYKGQ